MDRVTHQWSGEGEGSGLKQRGWMLDMFKRETWQSLASGL